MTATTSISSAAMLPRISSSVMPAPDDDDAEFFISEVRRFLDRVRDGLSCSTDDEAGRVIRDALHIAPEDVFARYSEASTALKNFIDIVASGNE